MLCLAAFFLPLLLYSELPADHDPSCGHTSGRDRFDPTVLAPYGYDRSGCRSCWKETSGQPLQAASLFRFALYDSISVNIPQPLSEADLPNLSGSFDCRHIQILYCNSYHTDPSGYMTAYAIHRCADAWFSHAALRV